MTAPANAKLLPFYLVVDVSYSMSGPKLEAVNKILPAVVDAVAKSPILADKIRIGLIDFSDDAQVRLPLCNPLQQNLTLPSLAVRGSTSFAAAFRLLRQEIEGNVKQLKADGFQVHRPAVFFLSDGMPTDNDNAWRSAYADLTQWDSASRQGFREYPNVVPCGVDDADELIMQSLIHPGKGSSKAMQMYMMNDGADAADAITAIAEILISSIVSSGNSMAAGGGGIILPEKAELPAGVSAYSADDDFL